MPEYAPQTARLWDPLTGEQKMELRGHDHQVEVVVFAPIASYNAIRELAGVPVRSRGVLRIYLTLRSEHGSGEKAWHICRHGFERQDNQALGHTERSDAEKPCMVSFGVVLERD